MITDVIVGTMNVDRTVTRDRVKVDRYDEYMVGLSGIFGEYEMEYFVYEGTKKKWQVT